MKNFRVIILIIAVSKVKNLLIFSCLIISDNTASKYSNQKATVNRPFNMKIHQSENMVMVDI